MADPVKNKSAAKDFERGFNGGNWFEQPNQSGATPAAPAYGSSGYDAVPGSYPDPTAEALAKKDRVDQVIQPTLDEKNQGYLDDLQNTLDEAKKAGIDVSKIPTGQKYLALPWAQRNSIQADLLRQIDIAQMKKKQTSTTNSSYNGLMD